MAEKVLDSFPRLLGAGQSVLDFIGHPRRHRTGGLSIRIGVARSNAEAPVQRDLLSAGIVGLATGRARNFGDDVEFPRDFVAGNMLPGGFLQFGKHQRLVAPQ